MAHVSITDVSPRTTYAVGSGGQATFDIPFAFFAYTDIRVSVNGAELAYNVAPSSAAQFSIAGNAVDDGYQGGTFTIGGGGVASATVIVWRDLPAARAEDFPYPSPTLDIRALNTALDKVFALLREIDTGISRSVRLADTDPTAGLTVPATADRLGKYLGFDASTGALAAFSAALNTSLASAFGVSLMQAADAAAACTLLAALAATGGTLTGALAMSGAAINEAQGADIASAGTVNLNTATGNLVDVTGTTAITAITLSQGRQRVVRFTGALTLTHSASLALPGAANIATAAGDFAIFRGYASGVVRCIAYSKANGQAVAAPAQVFSQSFTSSDQTITAAGLLTLAHGMSGVTANSNLLINTLLVCQLADANWAAGDVTPTAPFSVGNPGGSSRGTGIYWDATNIYVRIGAEATSLQVLNKTTGASAGIDNTKWKLRVRAVL